MSIVTIEDTNLTNIANAIRSKNGTSDTYKPSEMASAIELIETSGGGTEEYFETNVQLTTGPISYYLKKIPPVDFSNYRYMDNYFLSHKYLEEARQLDVSSASTVMQMYSGCSKLKKIYGFSKSGANNYQNFARECSLLESVGNIMTENCTNISYAFYSDKKLIDLEECDFGACKNINKTFYNCSSLMNLGGFKDLGKGYASITTENHANGCLDLSASAVLTYESLMNVINKLYDLNLTYDVANGGTLYSQQLVLGSTNLAKLTSEEIAIATNKGWVVS